MSSVCAWITDGARRVLPLGEPVDQHVGDAGLLQGGGERKAGRARADDQDVGFDREHGRPP
jgi:hypothetical protein